MGTAQAIWLLTGDDTQPIYQYNTSIAPPSFRSYHDIPHSAQLDIQATQQGFLVVLGDIKDLITIDNYVIKQQPLYVTWDYKNVCFTLIEGPL